MSTFITLPKASRGFLNVGTGSGEPGKIIERIIMQLQSAIEMEGTIEGIEVLEGQINVMNVLNITLIDKDSLGGSLNV